jgi:hypothetical protein
VKNWWASDTSLKDNAMEASDATNSFVRNHAGVSDQVPQAVPAGFVASGAATSEAACPAIAWLCWLPNLVFAELLSRKTRRRQHRLARRQGGPA